MYLFLLTTSNINVMRVFNL